METIRVRVDNRGQCDWSCLCSYRDQARESLLAFSDWTGGDAVRSNLASLRKFSPMGWKESIQVAQITGIEPERVFAANVFYDTARSHCACTAFGIDVDGGPIHAHCLDWQAESGILSRNAMIFNFVRRSGETAFISIGWPGFLGVLVGMTPGYFAVTLNAVWSEDQPKLGAPISFLLRHVLTHMGTYDQALAFLQESILYCDCLLLLSGIQKGQIAVIERTPSRSAVRLLSSGYLAVTNHYHLLQAGSNRPDYAVTGQEPFGQGSRERYEAALWQLSQHPPRTPASCFSLLADAPFRQENTILRVAMKAATGELHAEPVR